MATLDRWRELVATPKTLVFPRLELLGRDHAPSIVAGSGEVRMESPTDFTFTLTGSPSDVKYALAETNRQKENPYDGLARFRLVGTDTAGVNWAGGYTVPQIEVRSAAWTFTGEIEGLITDDKSATVSHQAGAELIFLLRVGDPMSLHLARYVRTDPPGEDSRREHTVDILGSSVRFVYEPSTSTLSITASHSPDFSAPFAENWLGEPLRILFGQPIYPRLVARNLGDGKASVWIRRSPGLVRGARWAALWEEKDRSPDNSAFWSTYTQLLNLVARDRGKDGYPNFEANKVTRLYEECIYASRGSRWVWALTFASSIEALTKMLIAKEDPPTSDKAEAISTEANAVAIVTEHIEAGPGEDRLKQIAIRSLKRSTEISTIRALRGLKAAGVITGTQLSAWETTRNAVMHGSLVSPYSTKEEDTRLLALAAMMHALTRELIRRL